MFNQRDPQWAGQRLGTRDGWTIGGSGCYVASQADVAKHFGKDVNPSTLDDIFTSNGLYYNELGSMGGALAGLCWDGMLTRVFEDIKYVGAYHCESVPCDLDELLWGNEFTHEAIIEVDFNHNPEDGIQTHFVRFNSYDPNTGRLEIDDPWYGDRINFSDRYGNPTETIQKIVRYSGPSLPAQESPATPAVTPPDSTSDISVVSIPEPSVPVVSTPVPETPVPVELNQPDIELPVPSAPENSSNPVETDGPSSSPSAVPPVSEPTITNPADQPIIKADMSKYLSRKFLLTAATWVLGIGGALLGYFTSTETVSLLGAVTVIYVYVQGKLDLAAK